MSKTVTSWVKGPRQQRTHVGPTLGAWVPKTHPSPLMAETYTLGDMMICRRAGEANYDLYIPSQILPMASGNLETVRAAGEELFAKRTHQDLGEPKDDEVDIQVSDQGSIILFLPRTPEGRVWIKDNVQDDAQWFGQSLVVEHRYASYLIEGMVEGGLRVSS